MAFEIANSGLTAGADGHRVAVVVFGPRTRLVDLRSGIIIACYQGPDQVRSRAAGIQWRYSHSFLHPVHLLRDADAEICCDSQELREFKGIG